MTRPGLWDEGHDGTPSRWKQKIKRRRLKRCQIKKTYRSRGSGDVHHNHGKKRPKVWEDLQDFEKKVPENRASTVLLPSFSPIGFPHLEAWTRISCGVHTCVEGCCPIMDLLRSEPMQLVQLIIPVEAAYRTISYLGDLGLFQFKDVSITPQIYSCLDCSWFRVRKFPYCNLGLLIGWWRMKTCDRRRLCVFPLIAEKAGEILENKIAVANKFNSN